MAVHRVNKDILARFEAEFVIYWDVEFFFDFKEETKEDLSKIEGLDEVMLRPITTLAEAKERKKLIRKNRKLLGYDYEDIKTEIDYIIEDYEFIADDVGMHVFEMEKWISGVRKIMKERPLFKLIYIGRYWSLKPIDVTNIDLRVGGVVSNEAEREEVINFIEGMNPPCKINYIVRIGEEFEADTKARTITPIS